MSKIEDALNKARKENGGSTGSQSLRAFNSTRQPNADDQSMSLEHGVLKRGSSTKEIALMDNGELFEENQLSELKVIYSDMDDINLANTYRDIRTKLIQKSQGKNFIAMITSCMPHDDISQVSLNMGTAFTLDESKTSLLIDCNLSKPSLDTVIGVNTDKGLTDYLEDETIDVEKILHKTGIKRLKLIPSGTSKEAATEYFTSIRMRELMSSLLARYSDRYIFLDSASVSESADTRILIELCDYVILVVPYGRATKKIILSAVEAIGNEKLLGVIFNDKAKSPI